MVMLGEGCDSFWLVVGAGADTAVPGMRAHLEGCPACRDGDVVRGCRPWWCSGISGPSRIVLSPV
jgi:hypothetical protein